MFKKIIALSAVACIAVAGLNAKDMLAKKRMVSSPFLIVEKIPHITRTVKLNWDNKKLNLSEDQKAELLKIRQNTMSSVEKITKEVNELEDEIAQKIVAGATPDELKESVNKIAQLKADTTMVHLNCIYSTKKILNEKQYKFVIDQE